MKLLQNAMKCGYNRTKQMENSIFFKNDHVSCSFFVCIFTPFSSFLKDAVQHMSAQASTQSA